MIKYAGDFEVHVTASADTPERLNAFAMWCDQQQVKCIRIVLARGEHTEQPMATWRRAATDLSTVVDEANRMAHNAEAQGIQVTRVKVEASPCNQDIPVADCEASDHPSQNYFEHHVKLKRHVGQPEAELTQVCIQHGAHLSRNAFRQDEDGTQQRFVTLRSYRVGRETSAAKLKELMASLDRLGENILEVESEYCVYDSNLALDDGWLSDPQEVPE